MKLQTRGPAKLPPYKSRFLQQVLGLLKQDHLPIEQRCARAGIHPATVYYWKCGQTTRPRLDTLEKLMASFGREMFSAPVQQEPWVKLRRAK